MQENEYLLSLDGEPIGTSTGFALADITQTPEWHTWQLVKIAGDEYTFEHRLRGTVIATLQAQDWSLKTGDFVKLELPED
jgi:hypothetical protein